MKVYTVVLMLLVVGLELGCSKPTPIPTPLPTVVTISAGKQVTVNCPQCNHEIRINIPECERLHVWHK